MKLNIRKTNELPPSSNKNQNEQPPHHSEPEFYVSSNRNRGKQSNSLTSNDKIHSDKERINDIYSLENNNNNFESKINKVDELSPEERDFLLNYKQKLENKIYYKFKTSIFDPFISTLGNNSPYLHLVYKVCSNKEEFLIKFSKLIYENFDFENGQFDVFWEKISGIFQDKLKQEFLVNLKNYLINNQLNKSLESWSLLQYNDYKNFLFEVENEKNNEKMKRDKQCKQKIFLDEQVEIQRRKKELMKEAEKAIDNLAQSHVIKNISTSELLYKQLKLGNEEKLNREIEKSLIRQLKNKTKEDNRKLSTCGSNRKNVDFNIIINNNDLNCKNIDDSKIIPISISVCNSVNHLKENSYNNKYSSLMKEKEKKEQCYFNKKRNSININNEFGNANKEFEYKEKQYSIGENYYFSNHVKNDTRNKYLDILSKQNNYNKSHGLKDYNFKDNSVKLDKYTIYNLRNSSNIFFV